MIWWWLVAIAVSMPPVRLLWRKVERDADAACWPWPDPSPELIEACLEVDAMFPDHHSIIGHEQAKKTLLAAHLTEIKAKIARDFDELLFARQTRFSDRAEVVLDDGTVQTFEWAKDRGQ